MGAPAPILAPIGVRATDGDPVEFHRRPVGRTDHYLVTEVLERWTEETPWPFLFPMPAGGDRARCWRVLARRSDQPTDTPAEYVLRMRSGPGVWDMRPTGGEGGVLAADPLTPRLFPGECLTEGCVLVDQAHTYAECTTSSAGGG